MPEAAPTPHLFLRAEDGPSACTPRQHHPQRHQRQRHDHELLEPDARRDSDEHREGEPDDVEGEVEDDAREQPEIEVEEAEANRRDDELDRPGERRLIRIGRVARTEHGRLHDERDQEEEPPLAEPIADEGRARERYGPEQTRLPEARLE